MFCFVDLLKVNNIIFLFLFTAIPTLCQDTTIPNFFKIRFRPSSTMGIYVAAVVPIDLPGRESYLGWFFEAIHSLPANESSYEYPPLVSKTIDRKLAYTKLESQMISTNYRGKPCLLRAICEVSKHPVKKVNGVLGDILHIILTPSSTKNFGLGKEYSRAEYMGKYKRNCTDYHQNCSTSILNLISWVNGIF